MIATGNNYTTLNGKRVRILATNRAHAKYPVVGLVSEGGKLESMKTFTKDGYVSGDQPFEYSLSIPRFTRRNPNLVRYVDNIEHNLAELKKAMA